MAHRDRGRSLSAPPAAHVVRTAVTARAHVPEAQGQARHPPEIRARRFMHAQPGAQAGAVVHLFPSRQ